MLKHLYQYHHHYQHYHLNDHNRLDYHRHYHHYHLNQHHHYQHYQHKVCIMGHGIPEKNQKRLRIPANEYRNIDQSDDNLIIIIIK